MRVILVIYALQTFMYRTLWSEEETSKKSFIYMELIEGLSSLRDL